MTKLDLVHTLLRNEPEISSSEDYWSECVVCKPDFELRNGRCHRTSCPDD